MLRWEFKENQTNCVPLIAHVMPSCEGKCLHPNFLEILLKMHKILQEQPEAFPPKTQIRIGSKKSAQKKSGILLPFPRLTLIH